MFNAEQAAEYIGIPVVVLERWAFLGQGPENAGTKWKPRYTEAALKEWLSMAAGDRCDIVE